jgi:hypothetical protein
MWNVIDSNKSNVQCHKKYVQRHEERAKHRKRTLGQEKQPKRSNDIITADRDKRYQRRSQQETPEPCEANTSNATREAMATIRLNATRWPCQRTQQERCEGIVSIRTKLILRQQLSSQGHQSP